MEKRRIVTIYQACEIAGVTRRTMYNWMSEGKVEFIRTAGGHRRIFVDTLFRGADRQTMRAQGRAYKQGPDTYA